MRYKVSACFQENSAEKFFRKLTDGTIENQEPDGREIIASMKRAVIDEHGMVRWSENCYCPTPLKHERETIYDAYFRDIQPEEISGDIELEGHSFMEHLAQLSRAQVTLKWRIGDSNP